MVHVRVLYVIKLIPHFLRVGATRWMMIVPRQQEEFGGLVSINGLGEASVSVFYICLSCHPMSVCLCVKLAPLLFLS